MHIAGEALGKAADDVKGVWEAGTSLITNALNSDNSEQTGEPVQGGEQPKGAGETGREIDVKERATPGADGATSQIIKETSDGETISITHQVKKGDQTIHQHQTHVGKSGARREFPESWREHKTINDKDSGGAAQ
jgi:hypothetical protein